VKPYELIVFDWDGTLIDSVDRIVSCMQETARIARLEIPDHERFKQGIGLDIREAVAELFMLCPHSVDVDALVKIYRQQFFYDNPVEMKLFDGVEMMLKRLNDSGYRLAIATGKSRIGLRRGLADTGLAELFEFTKVAEETAGKPQPDMLLQIVEQSSLSDRQLLMVGDSTLDLTMANNANVDAVGVLSGVHCRQRLQSCGPKSILTVASKLPAWLSGV